MKPLVLSLPWPPSVNRYWVRTRHGGMCVSARGRKFRNDVIALMCELKPTMLTGRLKIEIDLYSPTRREPDVDNFNKGIFDSLAHAKVIENDKQFVELNVCKRGVVKGGKAVVRITAAEKKTYDT